MKYRNLEKKRYERIKSQLFSQVACREGSYEGSPRRFCLDDDHSEENLFEEFRGDALEYFRARGITWHDGLPREGDCKAVKPSNHLCCSQSACVNCLWPFTHQPKFSEQVFRHFFPQLEEILPFDADLVQEGEAVPSLAFEWIGKRGTNYLGEVGQRSRGRNATSADFAFRFRRNDGRIQLVLGEWKYTEYYTAQLEPLEDINRTRLSTYRPAFQRWIGDRSDMPQYETLLIEPFYQLMRLSLLAQEMERARTNGEGEMGADIVSVVVIVPGANTDYPRSLTSAPLEVYGRTVPQIWTRLAPPNRFLHIRTEDLMACIMEHPPKQLQPWCDYLLKRYDWRLREDLLSHPME